MKFSAELKWVSIHDVSHWNLNKIWVKSNISSMQRSFISKYLHVQSQQYKSVTLEKM